MKPSHLPILSITSLISTTSAFQYIGSRGIGPGPQPFFAEANQTPNLTKSSSFSWPDAQGDSWTWTINITEVSVADAEPIGGQNYSYVNPLVANAVYSLSWPGSNESLGEAFNATVSNDGSPLCASWMAQPFPQNVTDLYTNTTSNQCVEKFGQQCINSIRTAWHSSQLDENGCHGLPLGDYVYELEGCEAFFPSVTPLFAGTTTLTPTLTAANGSSLGPLNEGQAFGYMSSTASNASDVEGRRANFKPFAEKLHMLVLDAGTDESFQVLCMRLNDTGVFPESENAGSLSRVNLVSVVVASLAVVMYIL